MGLVDIFVGLAALWGGGLAFCALIYLTLSLLFGPRGSKSAFRHRLLACGAIVAAIAIGLIAAEKGAFPGHALWRSHHAGYYQAVRAECVGMGGSFIERIGDGVLWLCIDGTVLSHGPAPETNWYRSNWPLPGKAGTSLH